ncbi:hypothetical protein AAFC00_000025 [Neodothiora populina]|uniref:Integral membrane protein n=1 Tax=Neodothiora populina TaxID=2781224 RepID=A0ABR3P1I0_9PEZI
MATRSLSCLSTLAVLATTARAHGHHPETIPEGSAISAEPIDSILWIHILIQMVAWGIVFPAGMVLGIVRSRLHVPVQIFGTVLAVVGYFLGHAHKGRQFAHPNAHASFATWLMLMLIAQIGLGVYLKLHIARGFMGKIRNVLVVVHGVLGKAMPVAAWVQMLFGGIVSLGFCRGEGDHTGQCLAHFIMGSAFIAYGILLTIALLVGQLWIRRTGRSQEFFDSVVIAAWGCVNTFTEHRWGGPWVHNDLQHTSMGIIWWCAGLAGVWLSRDKHGRPKRNFIPGFVILLTGWAMSGHPQALPLSTMVHTIFGYTLMAAGLARIIEVSFILSDRISITEDGEEQNSFQFIAPFLLYASGFLFMGATEEQMQLLSDAGVTHVAYILILYSIAFLLFLLVNMLLRLYTYYADSDANSKPVDPEYSQLNGHASNGRPVNGGHHSQMPSQQDAAIRDAEEFELDGLMTDDEDEVVAHKHQPNGNAPRLA